MGKRLFVRAAPRVALICDGLEEAIFAEASPIVFGIAWHQIGGPQVVEDASQTAVRRREVTRENVHPCVSSNARLANAVLVRSSFAPTSAASSG
jgi:hypothetical protein